MALARLGRASTPRHATCHTVGNRTSQPHSFTVGATHGACQQRRRTPQQHRMSNNRTERVAVDGSNDGLLNGVDPSPLRQELFLHGGSAPNMSE